MFSKSRSKQKEPLIVRDLDKLVAEPVSFKLHGKVHVMRPVTVQEFWAFTESMTHIQNLSQKNDVTSGDLVQAYAGIFQSVCPTITAKDVENMTQPQVGALLQFVIDTIKGASQLEDYDLKKKPTVN